MFERFTAAARTAVTTAADAARAGGTHEISVDHLLAALLPAVPVVDVSADDVLAEIAEARRRAGLSDVDARALAELGIDVEAVVAAAERELGPGALTADARRSGGRLRLAPSAREALVCALRQARALGNRKLRTEHLLLGVLAQRVDRVPADVLATRGVTMATVIAALTRGAA
jgi:ATP-dependent Clp protease ATP-binding subunit ClpA